ncbi:MAG: YvcK family protein [Terriglobales bacterium]
MSTHVPISAEQPIARRPLRVVAIGGGTGLSTLLRGLKKYVIAPGVARIAQTTYAIGELAAIVTVTDDGGSSGRLRKDLNILPPGDIRNCMVALSEDEAMLSRLFQHRFSSGGGLDGHNFGNLFLAALTSITGDFAEAVRESSVILASRGHIYPSTTSNVQLDAWMDDGSRVFGETKITASKQRITELRMVPANAQPLPQTLAAIAQADLITMGPGSLFTSLVPNVLVRGIPEAIAASRAKKVFVCNLMMQANESLGLSASAHIRAIRRHARMKLFDYALVNNAPVSPALLEKYQGEGAGQVACDTAAIEDLGVKCIADDLLDEDGLVRHNTHKLALRLMELAFSSTPPRPTAVAVTAKS